MAPGGPAGPAGPAGPQGAPGLAGVEIVTAESANSSNSQHQVDATCPAGKRIVGGGAQVYGANAEAALDESFPVDATKWRARAYEVVATADNWHVVAFAVCAVAS